MRQGDQFQNFLFFKKVLYGVKVVCSLVQYISIAFNLKYNRSKLYKTLEVCSILIFQRKVQKQFLHHILCMIFQDKCSSCYIILTDQISLFDCIYFLRYWAMCIAIVCFPGCFVISFKINLILYLIFYLYTRLKRQDKNYILRKKRAFKVI